MRLHVPETPTTKALVAALCTYETVAIVSGRVPTITAINRRWPVVGMALVSALAVHFFVPHPSD